jgi:hypothetical protein
MSSQQFEDCFKWLRCSSEVGLKMSISSRDMIPNLSRYSQKASFIIDIKVDGALVGPKGSTVNSNST